MLKKFRDILLKLLTTRVAWPIVLTVGLLCTVSIMTLELISPIRAERQQIHVAVGAAVILLVLTISFQNFGRIAFVLYALSLVLLVGVLGTAPINHARRWFQLTASFSIQPSEIAKIAYVLMLARHLRYKRQLDSIKDLLTPFLLTLIPFALILAEPDLGTALLFPLTLYAMLIAAGARLRHLLAIALIVILAAPGAFPFLKPYQQQRVIDFGRSLAGTGKPHPQQAQSRMAVAAGGIWGLGAEGAKYVRPRQLPEAYTDFIFAVVGVQWGFAGCLLIVGLYLAFFAASVEIAGSTKDPFGRLMVVGLASMMLFQAMINMGMTMGIGPVTGVALPFVSYGGSSLLASMLTAGLLLNVSVRRQTHSAIMQYAPA
ncbi:MAG: rod shape-determining protein RodA [Phycisphaerales bacterium]|nr:rod shape-determining protein RodA [Phycisphaerales bacterium]